MSEADEALAKRRYMILSALRFASVAAVMLGIAIAYKAIDAPWALGAGLAFGGLAMFFFGVRRLARRWKSPNVPTVTDDTHVR